MSGDTGLQEEDVSAHSQKPEAPKEEHAEPSPPNVGKFIGSPFWATLTNEVQALRDALEEDPSDDEQSPISPAQAPTNDAPTDHDILICPPASVYVVPGALEDPPPAMIKQLNDLFLKNADPVFKVLHRPSVERLIQGQSYLGHHADAPSNRALKVTMWFAAVTTIGEAECFARFRTSRLELLQLYRRYVDVALAQVSRIVSHEL